MDARRLQYLDALGIAVFAPRAPAAPAELSPANTAGVGPDAMDWDALASAVTNCTLCGLHATRTQTVFGVGNRAARVMVVGEAPGADEDRQGEPFVGRAGQLLNSMLRAAGFRREDVYIANVLKCRPPNNRDPRPEESGHCLPYLHRQIALVAPGLVLCVGRIAAQNLLATDAPLARMRGRVHRLGPSGVPVVVTYHPAYLLRSPGEKRRAWEDLKLALGVLRDGDRAARPAAT
jgi:DNA polymerase